MKEYTKVAAPYKTEYIVEKSRFIGTVAPCNSLEEAQEFIAMTSKNYWDATHNCTAFAIGSNQEQQRSSDDGEPSGTAGKPILEALKKKEITNTVIVVTRYFGGIKLGAGGLIRAYSHVANLALEEAPKELVAPRQLVSVAIPYSHFGSIELYLQEEHIYFEKNFAQEVNLTLYLPPAMVETMEEALTNKTNGQARWHLLDMKEVTIPLEK